MSTGSQNWPAGNVAPAGDGHMPGWLQLAVVAPVGAGTPAGCRAEKTLAQQTGLITTLRADDARNRAMMAEQQRREQQLRQQGEKYQRKYQDAIKNDECARRSAPGAVLGLLRGTDTTAAGAARAVSPESVFTPASNQNCRVIHGDIGSHALALQTALSICAGRGHAEPLAGIRREKMNESRTRKFLMGNRKL